MNQAQEEVAQNAYENYNFGEGVTVVDDEGWESDGTSDFTKKVYVEFDDAASESSHTISFHAKFKEKDSVELEDVYGLLMSNGSEIGTWIQAESKAQKKKI